MNPDEMEMMLEDCKATWREEARGRAKQDVKNKGLYGKAAEEFFRERMEFHYAALEKLGMENIR